MKNSSLLPYELTDDQLLIQLSEDELRAILGNSFNSSDWKDPEMDIYNSYDKEKKERKMKKDL